MKKLILVLVAFAGLVSAQVLTLNTAGHWNPIYPTDPDIGSAFYNIAVTGSTSWPALYCKVRRNDTPPNLFCYYTIAARDDADTTTAAVGLSGGTCLGTGTANCSVTLTHRSGPTSTVTLQIFKSIAPSEPADLDIGPMNASMINVDSAIAQALRGFIPVFDSLLTRSLNVMGGEPLDGRIFISSAAQDAVLMFNDEETHYFTITQAFGAGGSLVFDGGSAADTFDFNLATTVHNDFTVDDDLTIGSILTAAVLGTNGSGKVMSQSTTGGLGSVVLSSGPTIQSPSFTSNVALAYASTTASPAWIDGGKNLIRALTTGTLDTIVKNKAPVIWGATLKGHTTAESLFVATLFAADTSSYKPHLRADTLDVTYRSTFDYATASTPAYFNSSKRLVSGAFTGTGTTFALSASPTFTGTLTAATGVWSGSMVVGGTINSYPNVDGLNKLEVVTSGTETDHVFSVTHYGDAGAPVIHCQDARGTQASPQPLEVDDVLCSIGFRPWSGFGTPSFNGSSVAMISRTEQQTSGLNYPKSNTSFEFGDGSTRVQPMYLSWAGAGFGGGFERTSPPRGAVDIRGNAYLDRTSSAAGSFLAFSTANTMNWVMGQGNSTAPANDFALYSYKAGRIVYSINDSTTRLTYRGHGIIIDDDQSGTSTLGINRTDGSGSALLYFLKGMAGVAGSWAMGTDVSDNIQFYSYGGGGMITFSMDGVTGKATFVDTVTAQGFRSANYNRGGLNATFGARITARSLYADTLFVHDPSGGAAPYFYATTSPSLIWTSGSFLVSENFEVDGASNLFGAVTIYPLAGATSAFACLTADGTVYRSAVACPIL